MKSESKCKSRTFSLLLEEPLPSWPPPFPITGYIGHLGLRCQARSRAILPFLMWHICKYPNPGSSHSCWRYPALVDSHHFLSLIILSHLGLRYQVRSSRHLAFSHVIYLYPNPRSSYSCWRYPALGNYIFRSVAVLTTFAQFQVDEAI